jgi:3-oxoacyl-[acyl-carrier-protein] synthase-3
MVGVAAAMPEIIRTSAECEEMVSRSVAGFKPRKGIIQAISGIRERRVAADGVQCSDLAVDACRQVLVEANLDIQDVDLLIYASAGQDLIEPATAHIIQSKLGTSCAVFDVKNACNSFLNGLQLAEALISIGTCKTALVSVGEVSSRGVDWNPRDMGEFKRNLPGYTVGDAGAAALFSPAKDDEGIFYRNFSSFSDHWNLMTLPGGGSMHPHGDEHMYMRANGAELQKVFREEGLPFLRRVMHDANVRYTDFKRIFVHQVSLSYMHDMLVEAGIPADLVEETVVSFGNIAAASIPVAMAQAKERGAIGPGDRIMCIGLASGISIGVVMIDL